MLGNDLRHDVCGQRLNLHDVFFERGVILGSTCIALEGFRFLRGKAHDYCRHAAGMESTVCYPRVWCLRRGRVPWVGFAFCKRMGKGYSGLGLLIRDRTCVTGKSGGRGRAGELK